MAGGTPVITSNVSVMPEIAGEAALYVDPTKPYQLVERTMELFSHPTLQKQLVENGFKQAAKFTWVDSVNQLLKVYQQVLSK
jgi:glycosyltransferase involved in cell wall biosynthesis